MNPKPQGQTLFAVLLTSIVASVTLLTACTTSERGTNQMPAYYRPATGDYTTKCDLYLVMPQYSKRPELAINDGRGGFRDLTLPRSVIKGEIGRNLPNTVIVDVVLAGARFVAHSIVRESTPEGDRVWFEGELFYANKRVPSVSTLFIQSRASGLDERAPEIERALAERVR